jgi:hypothetical protein
MAQNPIDSTAQSNDPLNLVSAAISLGGQVPPDVTVKEVIIGESLLNPSAHVAVTLQSLIYTPQSVESRYFNTFEGKNWTQFKCKPLDLFVTDEAGNRTMKVSQKIYRCDNRRFASTNTGQVEELTLHAIDESILKDAETVWEKSWKCSTPSAVVKEALNKIKATDIDVDQAGPARPYVAESIHPLQVIQQQANVALHNGSDPSFVHYMTIDHTTGKSIHHFKSLTKLSKAAPYQIYASDTAITGRQGFSDPINTRYNRALSFNFPCDFDALTDILNGISCDGQVMNQTRTMNLSNGVADAVGQGLSIANKLFSLTNLGTAEQHKSCETGVEKYLHLRQARMALLDRDKIALRITIPWTPTLHAGDKIMFNWNNRYDESMRVYGTGEYIVAHLTHNIQFGGFAVTNLDCIANTLGKAGV